MHAQPTSAEPCARCGPAYSRACSPPRVHAAAGGIACVQDKAAVVKGFVDLTAAQEKAPAAEKKPRARSKKKKVCGATRTWPALGRIPYHALPYQQSRT